MIDLEVHCSIQRLVREGFKPTTTVFGVRNVHRYTKGAALKENWVTSDEENFDWKNETKYPIFQNLILSAFSTKISKSVQSFTLESRLSIQIDSVQESNLS